MQEGTRHHTASACVDSQPLTKYAEQEQHVHLGNMEIKPLACPFSQLTSPWESNHFTGLTFCVQEATQSPQDRYNVARWMLQHSTCYCWGGVGGGGAEISIQPSLTGGKAKPLLQQLTDPFIHTAMNHSGFHTHTHTHRHTRMHLHTHTSRERDLHVRTHRHTRMLTRTHTYTHIHIHTHTGTGASVSLIGANIQTWPQS